MVAPLPDARSYLAATTGNDGTIYAIGGGGNGNGPCSSVVDAYNRHTDTWTEVASLPLGRGALAATTGNDGTIYAIAGYTANNLFGTPEVDAYGPRTGTWTRVADLPYYAYGVAATTGHGGKIYAMGGYTQNYAAVSQVDVYVRNGRRGHHFFGQQGTTCDIGMTHSRRPKPPQRKTV